MVTFQKRLRSGTRGVSQLFPFPRARNFAFYTNKNKRPFQVQGLIGILCTHHSR